MEKYSTRAIIEAQVYSDNQQEADSFLIDILSSPPSGILDTGYSVHLVGGDEIG